MKITNSKDPQSRPPVVMLVYGQGGVGKTTFATTAPKPILADCEGGTKYLGLQGKSIDVGHITSWQDMRDFYVAAKDYETIIIDPIGELMEKLMRHMRDQNNAKHIQKDGSPTMQGWGKLKEDMRAMLKALRDTGRHVIIIAHVDEKNDEDRVIKRPLIMTKISEELINMVDIVGYMTAINNGEETKRVILVDPESDKYIAKDRTGQLGRVIEPDFQKIIDVCQGTKSYSWSKPKAVVEEKKTTKKKKQTTEETLAEFEEKVKEPVSTKKQINDLVEQVK